MIRSGPYAVAAWLGALVVALSATDAKTQTCSAFSSCEEAMRSYRAGNNRLDADRDGIPCEQLCGATRSQGVRTPSGGSIYIAPAARLDSPASTRQRAIVPRTKQPVSLISVGDGDTIRVVTAGGQKVTVRLACVDAPETAQGASGAEARTMLRLLVDAGGLEILPQTTDRYGRTVAEVYANGRNVNLDLVRNGAAYVYPQYLSSCDANAYLEAEAQAQRWRQGVWRWGGNEVRPWDFRRGT